MRILFKFRWFLFCAALLAASFSMAQSEDGDTQPSEELELIDETEQPTITIRKPDATREITERREQGVVTEVKVQTGGSTYYLYPKKPLGGNFDDVTSKSQPAMWRVHEFDVTGQKPEKTSDELDDSIDYTSDAPAPPVSE